MIISIVVPAYNEQENIQPFYDEMSAVLNTTAYEWEILFVNDGSSDETAPRIEALRAADSRVKLISFSRNYGSYSAISAGLLYVVGHAVVVISCDLQDPPALIPQFIEKWEAGADIVWGVRASRDDPGLKSLYANAFYWIVKSLVWSNFPSGGMDYGLFDRRIVALYNQLPVRNTIPFFTMYDMGFRQERIPYHRNARLRGTGNWTFLKRIKSALDVVLDFTYVPIRMVSAMGLVIAVISVLYGVVVALNRVFFGVGGAGWPSVVVITSFLGGIQLIVLGILGEYIWRVAEHVRGRPRFMIMQQHGVSRPQHLNVETYYPHTHMQKEIDHE